MCQYEANKCHILQQNIEHRYDNNAFMILNFKARFFFPSDNVARVGLLLTDIYCKFMKLFLCEQCQKQYSIPQ